MNEKPIYVTFGSRKLESNFESLKKGKFQDKQLYNFIERAIKDLKKNPANCIKIPRKLWPKIYIQKYGITNLWKYYTIKTNEVMILSVILEWFNHKEYESRFKY